MPGERTRNSLRFDVQVSSGPNPATKILGKLHREGATGWPARGPSPRGPSKERATEASTRDGNFLPGHPYQLAPTDDMDARNSSHLSPGIARAHGARQTHFSRGRHDSTNSTKGSHRR